MYFMSMVYVCGNNVDVEHNGASPHRACLVLFDGRQRVDMRASPCRVRVVQLALLTYRL
jgi:hypothetical protein